MTEVVDVAIVGAGPYGLSAGAHLRTSGVRVRQFGSPMRLWRGMPRGMFLKSQGFASNLSDPAGTHTLEAFCAAAGLPYRSYGRPVPLDTFIGYGQWFQAEQVPDLEAVPVTEIARRGDHYQLTLASAGWAVPPAPSGRGQRSWRAGDARPGTAGPVRPSPGADGPSPMASQPSAEVGWPAPLAGRPSTGTGARAAGRPPCRGRRAPGGRRARAGDRGRHVRSGSPGMTVITAGRGELASSGWHQRLDLTADSPARIAAMLAMLAPPRW